MPLTAAQIHRSLQEAQITTNLSLIDCPDESFILSGQIYAGQSGPGEYDVTVPSSGKAVMVSQSMRDSLASGEFQHHVTYLTREEVRNDNAHLPPEYRIIRTMPILAIRQGADLSVALTLRGAGASNQGAWGCASSFAKGPIDATTLYASLNRETGLLVDGQVAIFTPDTGDTSKIVADALKTKNCLSRKVPEMRHAFDRSASGIIIPTHAAAELTNKVNFHGALKGSVDCIVLDDQKHRTLTLIFPLIAEVPENATLSVFNGEGYPGPVTLARFPDLNHNKNAMPLIPGLQQYVYGT
jgi:hypothetical protein